MVEAMAGTIRVSRDFFDDGAFKGEPFTEREAFLWMIMEASFKPREKRIGRESVTLERGEFAASIRFMQKAWGWASTRRVHSFICALQKRNMLRNAAGTGFSVITLCNYDKYQSEISEAERERNAKRNARGTNENKDVIREEKEESARDALAHVVGPELADAFVSHRISLRSKMSPHAGKLMATELATMSDPKAAIEKAIMRGWKGVFEDQAPLKMETGRGRPTRIEQDVDAWIAGASRGAGGAG
jgi:hypothetical protein